MSDILDSGLKTHVSPLMKAMEYFFADFITCQVKILYDHLSGSFNNSPVNLRPIFRYTLSNMIKKLLVLLLLLTTIHVMHVQDCS